MTGGELFKSSSEQHSLPILPPEKIKILIERLGKLTENELYAYICGPILDAENKLFTSERNTALHKLAFSNGGPEKDVGIIRDASGKSVYKDPPDCAKSPETLEMAVATSNFVNGIDKNPSRPYSEASDIAHNLALLTVLDPEAELEYEAQGSTQKVTYKDCIKALAGSLNLEVRELLLLSAIKYTQRLGSGEKNPQEEDDLIRKAIDESVVPHPTIESVSRAHRVVNVIDRILEKRLAHLAQKKGWTLISPENSNHIFK